jgi:hypothetical protein
MLKTAARTLSDMPSTVTPREVVASHWPIDRPFQFETRPRHASFDADVDSGCGTAARKIDDIFFPLIGIHARLKLPLTRIDAHDELGLPHLRISTVGSGRSTRGEARRKAARWSRKCVQKEAGPAKKFGSGLFGFGSLVTL